ncbi:MAG: metallophosphoesterase [Cytophagales bacterium]|nr:metallophosphoesterase [Armatimonadota bacterium]
MTNTSNAAPKRASDLGLENPTLPAAPPRGGARIAGLALGGLLLALFLDAIAVEPFRLEVTRPQLFCPRLPPTLDGLSVLLLADLHASHWGRRERLFLELLETVERPDLILWNGDLITGREGIPVALDICRRVRARFPGCPTVITLGNGEHKIGGRHCRGFVQALRAAGFEVMINQHRPFLLRGEEITLGGTDDPFYGFADLERTLQGAPRDRFTLLFAHSPQIAAQAARLGVDAMLSGHTHGGQVRLPLIGALRTQNPLGLKMDHGTFDRKRLGRILGRDPGGDLVTYITRGIGAAQVPFLHWLAPRFLCRPEIAFVTLHRGAQ